jgi:hypothetical protein
MADRDAPDHAHIDYSAGQPAAAEALRCDRSIST